MESGKRLRSRVTESRSVRVASGAGAVPAHQSSPACRGKHIAPHLPIHNNESRQKVKKMWQNYPLERAHQHSRAWASILSQTLRKNTKQNVTTSEKKWQNSYGPIQYWTVDGTAEEGHPTISTGCHVQQNALNRKWCVATKMKRIVNNHASRSWSTSS